MSVSSVSLESVQAQVEAGQATQRVVAVMDKEQDVHTQQAMALIDMIRQAPSSGVGGTIDVYA
jgi:hypothetical protein